MLPSEFYAARPSDRLAMLALQQLEEGTHAGCGRPIEEAFSKKMADGGYELEVHTCQACAAMAKATNGNNPEVKLEPGDFVVPIAAVDWKTGEELPPEQWK